VKTIIRNIIPFIAAVLLTGSVIVPAGEIAAHGGDGKASLVTSTKTLNDANRRHQTLTVGPGQNFGNISDALEAAADGDTLMIYGGIYNESGMDVSHQVTIIGVGRPVIDVDQQGEGIRITANNVHIQGLEIRNVPVSHSRDHAAIRFDRVTGGKVIDNILDNTFFGIYLARSHDIEIRGNHLKAYQTRESMSANGIHLWNSDRALIIDNTVEGHRDGIYLEYVRDSEIRGNKITGNIRYGLHFMFSDDCRYHHNRFEDNGAGVAVMYSRRVIMEYNRFAHNWGSSSYGLLLKEITDSEIRHNDFIQNTTGIRSEGSDRVKIHHNRFARNGWAIRIMASSTDNMITKNNFIDNAFDVATNSRRNNSTFEANYWDKYSGYDLSGDGFGDVPYRPVRLFSLIVERNPMALTLLRSLFVQLLDMTERIMPTITPETLVDEKPLMREVSL
jgi:nitrous oxidase accessory protein